MKLCKKSLPSIGNVLTLIDSMLAPRVTTLVHLRMEHIHANTQRGSILPVEYLRSRHELRHNDSNTMHPTNNPGLHQLTA